MEARFSSQHERAKAWGEERGNLQRDGLTGRKGRLKGWSRRTWAGGQRLERHAARSLQGRTIREQHGVDKLSVDFKVDLRTTRWGCPSRMAGHETARNIPSSASQPTCFGLCTPSQSSCAFEIFEDRLPPPCDRRAR